MEFRGTLTTEPDQHSRCVDPVERGDFTGDFYCFITLQSLQCLNKKHAVICIAIRAVVAMHAFSLKNDLPFHGGYPSLAPHRASSIKKISTIFCRVRCLIGGATKGQGDQQISDCVYAKTHDATVLQ